jgi:tetratricopeptide (TPR) repeat protein
MTFFMPQHPVAGFCAISGPLLWSCGRFAEAAERYESCRRYAQEPEGVLGPFTSAYAHTFCAWMAAVQGDYSRAAEHAGAAMAIGQEHGLLVWIGAAYPHLGIATAMLGDATQGVGMISEGVTAWRGAGSALFISYYQHGLGLALEAAGDWGAALRAVDDGIAHAWNHAERFHLSELHRLRARLLSKDGRTAEAAAERRYAAEVANVQGARLFEVLALQDLCETGEHRPDELARLADLVEELWPEARGRDDALVLLERAQMTVDQHR